MSYTDYVKTRFGGILMGIIILIIVHWMFHELCFTTRRIQAGLDGFK